MATTPAGTVPASSDASRETVNQILGWAIGLAVVIVIAFGIQREYEKPKPTEGAARSVATAIPLASAPQLVIPAGGQSERIPASPGKRVQATGNTFQSHYVYADGTECQFGSTCPPGITALYFTNTNTTSPTMVTYMYVE